MAAHTHEAIRVARIGDAEAIATLVGELGYPTEPGEAGARLERLSSRADAGVIVYERDGAVVGLASYQIIDLLERPQPQCRITALVVRSDQQRRGVARALVNAVEHVALERECFRLEVTTRPQRREAAAFYEALGFEERPRRLVKTLTGNRN